MKRLLIAICLICLLSLTSSFAQNSAGADGPVDKAKVIQSLLAENDAAQGRITALEAHERALQDEIAKADAATAATNEAYKAALIELGRTQAQVESLKEAIAEREKQVAELRSQRDEARADRDKAQAEVKSVKSENRLLKLVLILEQVARLIGH